MMLIKQISLIGDLKQTTSIDVVNTKCPYDYFMVNIGKLSKVTTAIFNDPQ